MIFCSRTNTLVEFSELPQYLFRNKEEDLFFTEVYLNTSACSQEEARMYIDSKKIPENFSLDKELVELAQDVLDGKKTPYDLKKLNRKVSSFVEYDEAVLLNIILKV